MIASSGSGMTRVSKVEGSTKRFLGMSTGSSSRHKSSSAASDSPHSSPAVSWQSGAWQGIKVKQTSNTGQSICPRPLASRMLLQASRILPQLSPDRYHLHHHHHQIHGCHQVQKSKHSGRCRRGLVHQGPQKQSIEMKAQ